MPITSETVGTQGGLKMDVNNILDLAIESSAGRPTAKEICTLTLACEKLLLLVYGFKTVSVKIVIKKIIRIDFTNTDGQKVEARVEKTDSTYQVKAWYTISGIEEVAA